VTRVDFYILPDADEETRQTYVCRVAAKAYGLGHRVWIHAPKGAAALDDRLWTFSQGSFVPHERAGDEIDGVCPIIVGEGGEPDDGRELLINEDGEVPPFFSRFERVAEVINQDEDIRKHGRTRYAFYRDRGYELHYHRLS